VLLYAISLIKLVLDFKNKALQMRRGVWPYPVPKDKIPIIFCTTFAGTFISNSMVSFLINVVLFTIVFTPLLWPLFWKFVGQKIFYVLITIIPALINAIVIVIFKRIACAPDFIKRRRLFALLDLFLYYTGILAGIVGALVRFILLLAVSLFGITRVDTPLYPNWVLSFLYLDAINKSYIASIFMYHIHNHPIAITFNRLLLASLKRENNMSKQDHIRICRARNRWHMARLLIRQPWLIKHRNRKPMPEDLKLEIKKLRNASLNQGLTTTKSDSPVFVRKRGTIVDSFSNSN